MRITYGDGPPATLVIIYRPPSSSVASFFTEFATLLENHALTRNVVIVGDFNFHMDNLNNANAHRLTDLLDHNDLHQPVRSTTHLKGHTLDLVIPRESDGVVLKDLMEMIFASSTVGSS